MRVHLIHGFNVSDGGRRSVGNLIPMLEAGGHEPVLHDYGWTGPLRLRLRNRNTVRDIASLIGVGDALIGHSNGALICRNLVHAVGDRISAVVAIQPCVRRDLTWPSHMQILCLHNDGDWAVRVGRMWGRMSTLLTPFAPHGWGAAGAHGFTTPAPNVENWDTAAGGVPSYLSARGHSAALRHPAVDYWGHRISDWLLQASMRTVPPGMQAVV